MGSNRANWCERGISLPSIEPHTKAKHLILEEYVTNWIIRLCGDNMSRSKKVTLIDGFCGGGKYFDPETDQKWEGSPLRIIRAVFEGLRYVREQKSKPYYKLDFKFIFIDSQPEHIACLKLQLSELIHELGMEYILNQENEEIQIVCAEFENFITDYVDDLGKRKGHSLFFLDPFGYTDVSMESLNRIIKLQKSEVIFTYMIDFITRFLSERAGSLEKAHKILHLEKYYAQSQVMLNTREKQIYLKNETLRLFRNESEAPYVFTFAVIPKSNNSSVLYYLVHLASHATAQEVIKGTLWKYNNLISQFQYGAYGLGFKTLEYFESQNPSLFDIKGENLKWCIEELTDNLIPHIYNAEEGITLQKLHISTMQTNPATLKHYKRCLIEQRKEKEIAIYRDGKIMEQQNILPTDIITKPKYKQLKFFL